MLLFRLAFRSLLLQRAKSITIGAFLVFGTLLILVGNAMLDAMDSSMAESIIRSITGHLQVYSEDAEDELKLFGSLDIGRKEYGAIHDFSTVKTALSALPEVKDVVPMGVDNAVVFTGNILDRRLSEMRTSVGDGDMERATVVGTQVRKMVDVLKGDWQRSLELIDTERAIKNGRNDLESLEIASKDAFWTEFQNSPLDTLEFLENKVAPLALDADLIWIGYIGTDMRVFEETFSGYEVVDGTGIPPGRRGFMFNKVNYERQVKNKIARRLDQILEKLDSDVLFEECEDCQTWTKQNQNQIASIVGQLDTDAEPIVRGTLQKALGTDSEDLSELLLAALSYENESQFRERHALFYKAIAPHIVLYTIPIGGTLTISAFGRGGYVRKVPVKVYGTYRFRSMDGDAMGGGFNLMDLMTFRELYGYMTEERRQEIADIRAELNVEEHDREDIEDALFGDESEELVEESTSTSFEAQIEGGAMPYDEAFFNREYTREEMASGVVLNAAVMLEDGVSVEDAERALKAAIKEHGLGLQVTSWRKAAGLWGDFIKVAQGVLHGAVLIIFLVALLIINNTLMMSTLERTREIGTMRAIGASRSFVRRMIYTETAILALIFGGLGVVLGCGIVGLLTHYGIPPWNSITRFFFAGGHLRPELAAGHVFWALGSIVFVSLAATLYPVSIATRITPLIAMQSED